MLCVIAIIVIGLIILISVIFKNDHLNVIFDVKDCNITLICRFVYGLLDDILQETYLILHLENLHL